MKTTLSMIQRYHLLEILPKEENLSLTRIKNSLKNKLAPSEEEHKEFGILYLPNGSVQLGRTGKKDENGVEIIDKDAVNKSLEEREIDFGEKEVDILIKPSLKKVDKEKKVTEALIPLYDKFFGVDYNGGD